MKIVRDRVERGRLVFEGAIEADFVETIRAESNRRSRWRDVAHRTWLYDGHVPINMHVVDEMAVIWLCHENRAGDNVIVKGLLESEHPAVVSWAESLFEEYRDEADPLEPPLLSAE
jgi:predicted transcriptional regulator